MAPPSAIDAARREDVKASIDHPQKLCVPQRGVFAAVLFLLLYTVFALAERKNGI
jgi:hypothetical protein